jgi:hypothetical protein
MTAYKRKTKLDFKDSGERQNFQTGAVRDTSSGKGRFDLMPPIPLFLVSKIYETGCLKYGDRNWEKGIPISRYLDSAQRHILKYQAGLRDEPHLSMASWNCLCALWTACMVTLGLRPSGLYDLPNHVSHDNIAPLSDFEAEGLETFLGRPLEKSNETVHVSRIDNSSTCV